MIAAACRPSACVEKVHYKMCGFILLALLMMLPVSSWAQTAPLLFENNYFVTGDYVVGGVGLRGLGTGGYATGTINIPDSTYGPSSSVPTGADIIGAFLYWETVESSQNSFVGQKGFFRGYPITGVVLGNPNAPVSWSSGGCNGNSNGSKTMRTYRADVRAYLPVNPDGSIQANNSYQVKLADSGSNGGAPPLTLGATLVIIWRALDKSVPLNAIVLYDGAYAPSNGQQTMSLTMQGFYQPVQPPGAPVGKLTHIVGNGQPNKNEQVFLGSNALTPPNAAAFPGKYNGSWDNPTYTIGQYINAADASEVTSVVPSPQNSGCVSWGAVVMSTTVQDTDNDGLLDVWEANQGYCDAAGTSGSCNSQSPSWVALPNANPNVPDAYVQIDYLCSVIKKDGSCDTVNGHTHLPPAASLSMVTSTFTSHGVNLHLAVGNPILEQSCSDNPNAQPPTYCSFPGQPGVVGWKGGLEYFKNQPMNYPDEATCEQHSDCVRRFQHGRKDSYHYAFFGHALGVPSWNFRSNTLVGIALSGNTATFTTSVPHGLTVSSTDPNGRVTVSDAITNPALNGLYFVTSVQSPTVFTATLSQSVSNPITFTATSDPHLSIAAGQGRSGSGYSDVGGDDSLITLGLWGPDGQTAPVQAGTFLHELGHSLGLTHGGFYYDIPGSYIPTVEANCKPNYQSVMNYLFQVDLLGPSGTLDYSGQEIIPLNEQALSGVNGLTTTDQQQPTYLTTKWYGPSAPFGVGSPATHFCDGTPLPVNNPPAAFRLDGPTSPLTWLNNQDINFNNQVDTSLRGYNDWAHIDFRQIGATGSDVAGGPGTIGFGAGTLGFGAGTLGFGAGTLGFGAGTLGFGAGTLGFGAGTLGFGAGEGAGEINFLVANSTVRPPTNLTGVVTPPPRHISLNWAAPKFGQVVAYNLYRGVNGATPSFYVKVTGGTSYVDQNVSCGPKYTYFVTALLSDNRESAPSNVAGPFTACAPPYIFTGYYSPLASAGDSSNSGSYNLGKSVTAKWTLQDQNNNYVTNLQANTLIAVGPISAPNCPLPGQVPVYYNSQPPYPYATSTLYSPTSGAKGKSTFRISSSGNQFIFNWDTSTTGPGCYVLELDLDSGQVERTSLRLQ
jgi:hypothetical protein